MMRMVRVVMCVTVMIVAALGSLTVGARRDLHPLFDLMTREEMVDLAGYGEEKLSTVLVNWSLLCQDHESSTALSSPLQPISGAVVGVTCHGKKNKSSWEKTLTDKFGDFTVDLPSHLHTDRNLDKACKVKVVRVPSQSPCSASFTTSYHHKWLKLSSTPNGVRTYSSGKITLQNMKSNDEKSKTSIEKLFTKIDGHPTTGDGRLHQY